MGAYGLSGRSFLSRICQEENWRGERKVQEGKLGSSLFLNSCTGAKDGDQGRTGGEAGPAIGGDFF